MLLNTTLPPPAGRTTMAMNYATLDIYDAENDGPAVWAIDIGLGVLFSLCLLQAFLGNAVILFLLARYRPYIRLDVFALLSTVTNNYDYITGQRPY